MSVFIPSVAERRCRGIEAASRGCVPQIGNAERVQGRRGASDARSRSHDDFDPAKICGFASDQVHQGKECNPLGPCLWRSKAQFHRVALLGQGYFVSTIGQDEVVIREYIRKQEVEDTLLDQLNMWR